MISSLPAPVKDGRKRRAGVCRPNCPSATSRMISVVVAATLVTDARSRNVSEVIGSPGRPTAGSWAQPPSAMLVPAAVRTPAMALAGWLPAAPRASSRSTAASIVTVTG